MSVIIEANYAKKLGLPEYSSHQYAVTLRLELTDLSQLEKVNAELYARLQASVDSQITKTGFVPGKATPPPASPSQSTPAPAPADAWKCSDKQRDLILKIIGEHALDKNAIEELAQSRFGAGVRQLNKLQASALIDELIETHGGKGQRGQRQAYAGGGRR